MTNRNTTPASDSGDAVASLTEYYSASQLRSDRWINLKSACTRLAGAADRGPLERRVRNLLISLEPIEFYWAFPSESAWKALWQLLERGQFEELSRNVSLIVRALVSGSYRRRTRQGSELDDDLAALEEDLRDDQTDERTKVPPYFEVLIVDSLTPAQQDKQRHALQRARRSDDSFIYEPVFVPSFEDALIAALFNFNIQSVVIRPGLTGKSRNQIEFLRRYIRRIGGRELASYDAEVWQFELSRLLHEIRPEIDIYLVTDESVEVIAGLELRGCRRVFYNQDDFLELHVNIQRGVDARYETPFFNALKQYSRRPTGVFHALPISRGKSIVRSHWIGDMIDFYGINVFMAETSATSGGLDSLLAPTGSLKLAQEYAARAFGAERTYFATNGTSTCNKIVVQAVVRPGDIVLVDRDCHKSHHYGMVLAGAQVVYLDSYPLNEYSMYGAVPLKDIKHRLLELKAAGKLNRVRMLLLTNCTFDGVVYNVERVMEECLAIKPDLVFLWDEAWFAFARFGTIYRQRTAMYCAETLRDRYRTPEYRERWQAQQAALRDADSAALLTERLLPDPDKVRIRVYATQSTHKTLTSLRQGSMIHVRDQDFKGEVAQAFHEAYMTHTSTSPNYQILASLDLGRRQVELEGLELIQKQVETAMAIRKAVNTHPLISKYFRVLNVSDMVPAKYRPSGVDSYLDNEGAWSEMWDAWSEDEFAIDPSRITLAVGATGYDGDTFKNAVLMDRHGIQVNKTSRNTVLLMTNIGTTRSSVAYLIEVLVDIARELDERLDDAGGMERRSFDHKVRSLMQELPPLPDFSRFHDAFRANDGSTTIEGDIRSAFFLAYDESHCEYYMLEDDSLEQAMQDGRELVSTSFIIPYPPGFPILVPGQIISREIVAFMRALDVKEIHGYEPELGLRVFSQAALDEQAIKPGSVGQ
ncbi:MAG: aminotransferase class I/II-fold pyridoxal phosphate-dependent enzyme [Steroidobacteraceae bacterium]